MMDNFDLISQALRPDPPSAMMKRLRAGIAVYLNSYGLPRTYDDIEDVCGSLRVRALEHAQEHDQSRPLEGWLMVMAHNLVREAKRHANQKTETPVSQLTSHLEEEEAQSQIEFFERMRDEASGRSSQDHRRRAELPLPALEELLPSLSSLSQTLLCLSITHGWEIAQIAAHLGKERGAVDTGLCRARAALHKAYMSWKRELERREDAPKSRGSRLATTSDSPLQGGDQSR